MPRPAYLIVDDNERYIWRLRWYFPDDEDTGGALGETSAARPEPKIDPKKPDTREDWEAWTADVAADKLKHGADGNGFYWETLTGARVALAAIKKKLKDGPDAKPDVVISNATAVAALALFERTKAGRGDTADVRRAIAELKKGLGRKK